VSSEGGNIRLDRAWDVLPDLASSLFFVTPTASHAVIYRNRFQGRPTYAAHDSDSTAVLVWGLCYDMVVAENDISRMRHGIMVAATSGTRGDSVSAPFFVLVRDNRISEGNNGIYTGLTFGYDTDRAVTGGLGNVFRGNLITRMTHIGIAVDTWDSAGGDANAVVFERNTLADLPYGVVSGLKLIWTGTDFRPTPRSGTRLRQMVLHGNRIERGDQPLAGSIGFRSDTFQHWLDVQSAWTGFADGNGLSAAR
jgi:polygalacturonase